MGKRISKSAQAKSRTRAALGRILSYKDEQALTDKFIRDVLLPELETRGLTLDKKNEIILKPRSLGASRLDAL